MGIISDQRNFMKKKLSHIICRQILNKAKSESVRIKEVFNYGKPCLSCTHIESVECQFQHWHSLVSGIFLWEVYTKFYT